MKLSKKNKLLVAGFIFTLYICYAFAIANTLGYYKEYSSQKELTENNVSSPATLKALVQKEKQLNNLLSKYNSADGDSFQNELLKHLSRLSKKNGLKIIGFKEPHVYPEKELKITSYSFSLEGSFNGILLLVNSIENNPSLGKVIHIAFVKKRNYKTNSDYLTAEIILQKTETIKST